MYYEERWIDGKFCWRTSPNGAWTAYTANELAHRYQAELQRAHDAQRALDAEREKVKELVANQAEYEKCTDEQITALNQGCLDYEKQIATLQAQLAEIEQILCIESGKTTVDKVRDLHHSFKQVWNSYQSAVNELFDTQAQLRQVEGAYQKLLNVIDDSHDEDLPIEIIEARDEAYKFQAAKDARKAVSSG